jgi:hypothetical protein
VQASFVVPFIASYGREYRWIWALELLPAYDAVARGAAKKPGALANGCHRRLGNRLCSRLLDDDLEDTYCRSDATGRPVGRVQSSVLIRLLSWCRSGDCQKKPTG